MPLYSFICKQCNTKEEHLVPYEEREKIKIRCRNCEESRLKKFMTFCDGMERSNFHLKGRVWGKDGYTK